MLVVTDNSPLDVLIRLGHADVLATLFGHVLMPTEVARELANPRTPAATREFLRVPPRWLEIREPSRVEQIAGIDPGETAAIALAVESAADLLLLDDADARRAATRCGLAVAGTLGVLERAADRGLLDLSRAHDGLRASTFRVSERLLTESLARHHARRASGGR